MDTRPIRSPDATYTWHIDLIRYGYPDPHNCDVQERTADDVPVGRCWFYLEDGRFCPRHGDIYKFRTAAQYRAEVE